MKKIAIASDHAGYLLKEKLLSYLIKEKNDVKDFGCFSEEKVDYPDFGHPLANAVSKENTNWEYLYAVQEMELT